MNRISGVYLIFNRPAKKIYIGSSVDIYTRWNQHRWHLRIGEHANEYLQRAYDKYGVEAFEFKILEKTKNLVVREQWWLDRAQPFGDRGYNILHHSERRPEHRKLTDDDIKQIKQALMGGISQSQIAMKFNVHYSLVSMIYRGKLYYDPLDTFNQGFSYGLGKPKPSSRGNKNRSNSHWSRLSESKVKDIRKLLAEGQTAQSVAAQYGVARSTIAAIHIGQNWSWLS